MKLKEKLLKALKENGIVPKYYLDTEYNIYHFYFEDEDESIEIGELFDELTKEQGTKQDNTKHESGWTQEQYDRINQKLLKARISP